MTNIRFEALKEAWSHKPAHTTPLQRGSVIFSQNVFTREKMKEYIASNVVEELFSLMDNEKTLSRDIANSVAIGMKTPEFLNSHTFIKKFYPPPWRGMSLGLTP